MIATECATGGAYEGARPLTPPSRSAVRMIVGARFLERSFATVREVCRVSLEACANVAMPSLGLLAESIRVGRAGHMHTRDIPSALFWGRPRRPGLRVSARRNGKEATERHKPSDLGDHVPLPISEDVQAFTHLAALAHVLT